MVAHAVWQALQFCKDVGYHSVLVEFSNGSLMPLLRQGAVCLSEISWLIQDIQDVAKMFTSVSFTAIPRHCNQAAHVLAAFAKEKGGVSVRFDLTNALLFSFPLYSILYLMNLYLSFIIKKKKKMI